VTDAYGDGGRGEERELSFTDPARGSDNLSRHHGLNHGRDEAHRSPRLSERKARAEQSIRAFIAVPLTPETIQRLLAPIDELRTVCRAAGLDAAWSRPEGWHLTLKFLGPVAADRIDPLLERLPGCTVRHQPFAIQLTGFGAFPTARRPRVLWIGLEPDDGAASLVALAREIDDVTATLGHPSEERPFSPHLTVARLNTERTPPRSLPSLTNWLEGHGIGRGTERLAGMRVEQFALMRSDAQPGGAVYTPIASFPLG
jgi:2'-5' RNA ligase